MVDTMKLTNQAIHLRRVHRIWGYLVLHVQDGEGSVLLKGGRVVTELVKKHT